VGEGAVVECEGVASVGGEVGGGDSRAPSSKLILL